MNVFFYKMILITLEENVKSVDEVLVRGGKINFKWSIN